MAWRTLDKAWHDTDVEYCDVCGNLLIKRAWVFQGRAGELVRACREDDERLYAVLHEQAPGIEKARRAYEARAAKEVRADD